MYQNSRWKNPANFSSPQKCGPTLGPFQDTVQSQLPRKQPANFASQAAIPDVADVGRSPSGFSDLWSQLLGAHLPTNADETV